MQRGFAMQSLSHTATGLLMVSPNRMRSEIQRTARSGEVEFLMELPVGTRYIEDPQQGSQVIAGILRGEAAIAP